MLMLQDVEVGGQQYFWELIVDTHLALLHAEPVSHPEEDSGNSDSQVTVELTKSTFSAQSQ